MIYLWHNSEKKEIKMGHRDMLKEEYKTHDQQDISVLHILDYSEVNLAKKIISQFQNTMNF
ncbi:hypothetical protein N6H18_11980 [Reichenbachiella agarivorans]|uniref:Uncharacterized protein n=1 Tax=Reichenbachiella agarivorans TaxID=2979464 RepID=A0ABY6CKZ5_9BACT|nr:hypothetical protein [Reichenbachiella agarivorans]UXP31069.1 hypothetical protein N6H18_11980 [Reichenbachiella agarivorans]